MIRLITIFPTVTIKYHTAIKVVIEFSRYNLQYIPRLLVYGKPTSLKIGQIWLKNNGAFEAYLEKANLTTEWRYCLK